MCVNQLRHFGSPLDDGGIASSAALALDKRCSASSIAAYAWSMFPSPSQLLASWRQSTASHSALLAFPSLIRLT